MMQFNMYHHYTVDEHLLRCIGILNEIERGGGSDTRLADELIHKIQPCAPQGALRHAVPARHRQGPAGGSFHRGRARRQALLPAARLHAGRDRALRLADHQSSGHVERGAVARPVRPQDHRELRQCGAGRRAAEAALHPHHRRHQGGRPRRVERLEGAAHPHALFRDRAGGHRRLLGGQPRPARGAGADRVPRRHKGLAAGRARRLYRQALPGLLAEGRSAAQDRARQFPARRRPRRQDACQQRSASTAAMSPSSRCWRPTTPGCCRSSPAPAPWRAPISWTRRSTPPPMGARSTPSRSRANSSATRTRSGAPAASRSRSRKRCAANCACPTWWASAARPRAASRPSRSSRPSPSTTSGPTATPWWRSPGSTAPACSTN